MNKIFLVLAVTLFSVTTTFAQTLPISITDLEKQFTKMGDDLAGPVASSATNGLTWSDAYIGNFPHLGAGIFTSAQIIPVEGFTDVLKTVNSGASLPSQLTSVGVPVPSFGLDARLGGFILPFDIGVKFAMLPSVDVDKVNFDYMLVGGDLRYALLKGNAVLPKVSVGVGYSYLKTEIGVAGILAGDYELFSFGGDQLILKNPDMVYGWESNVVEFKAQVSKNFLILTPYLGANAAYSTTKIGGGLKTSVVDGAGVAYTQQQIDDIIAAARAASQDVPDIDATGFNSYTTTTAWTLKVFGGTSINLAVVKIDLGLNYDVLGKTYGGQLGVRFQL